MEGFVFDAAKQLKIVVRAGAGYDNVDLASATAHGVCVMNTPGQNANAVAELVAGLMVYAVRNFYNGTSGIELRGKKLGIHAFGNVGRNVARIAKGFGMEVYAFDAYCPKEAIEAAGVHAVDNVEDMYKTCQFISLHLPATDETKNSIGKKLVSLMPKGAVLVNSARKEIINEDELIKLMQEREDLKFVSDIAPAAATKFEELFADRYFATPKKMGAQTAEANIGAIVSASADVAHPAQQGLAQAFSVYVDTLLVCTATALMILSSGMYNIFDSTGEMIFAGAPELANNYVSYTQTAVDSVFKGFGGRFVSIAMVFFVFSTVMAYYFYSESSIIYLFRKGKPKWESIAVNILRVITMAAVIFGAVRETDVVWQLGDIGVGLMAWVTVISVLILCPAAIRSLKDYETTH